MGNVAEDPKESRASGFWASLRSFQLNLHERFAFVTTIGVPVYLVLLILVASYVLLLSWPITHASENVACREQQIAEFRASLERLEDDSLGLVDLTKDQDNPLFGIPHAIERTVNALAIDDYCPSELKSLRERIDAHESLGGTASTSDAERERLRLRKLAALGQQEERENGTGNGDNGGEAGGAEGDTEGAREGTAQNPPATTPVTTNASEAQVEESWDAPRQGNALFLAVLSAGIIGGAVYSLRAHTLYIARRRYEASWWQWNVSRPFLSGALAILFFFVVRAGFVQDGNNDALKPEGFIAIGGMVGLFTDNAWLKLRQIAASIFASTDEDDAARRAETARLEGGEETR